MIGNYKRFLLLAPHTDDVELGCGGTIAKFLEEKMEIHVAVFSTAEKSVPKGFPKTALRDEFYRATSVLGIKKKNLSVYNYEVRKLSYSRQEVLEELVTLRKRSTQTSYSFHQQKTCIKTIKQCTTKVSALSRTLRSGAMSSRGTR